MKNKITGFLIDSKSVAIFSNDLTHASLAKWINLTSPNSSELWIIALYSMQNLLGHMVH